jgi:hypothetical protein
MSRHLVAFAVNVKDVFTDVSQLLLYRMFKKKRKTMESFCALFVFKFLSGGFITSIPDAAFK